MHKAGCSVDGHPLLLELGLLLKFTPAAQIGIQGIILLLTGLENHLKRLNIIRLFLCPFWRRLI
jgi:hypothetical protein